MLAKLGTNPCRALTRPISSAEFIFAHQHQSPLHIPINIIGMARSLPACRQAGGVFASIPTHRPKRITATSLYLLFFLKLKFASLCFASSYPHSPLSGVLYPVARIESPLLKQPEKNIYFNSLPQKSFLNSIFYMHQFFNISGKYQVFTERV